MVMTIEPGLYISPTRREFLKDSPGRAGKYLGIGVRSKMMCW